MGMSVPLILHVRKRDEDGARAGYCYATKHDVTARVSNVTLMVTLKLIVDALVNSQCGTTWQ